jgi:hypothetical protein
MKSFLGFLLLIAVWSCSHEEKEECVTTPDITNIKLNLTIESLQDSFVNVASKAALVRLLTSHPEIRDYVFRRAEYRDDSVFINELYSRFNNPHLDTLLAETKKVFGDLTELKAQFTEAFSNLTYYYPTFHVPKIQTVISGLDTDLLVTDSLIIVSLDFYLGPGAAYRPNMYDYLLRQYKKETIVPSCLLIYGIQERFNKTNIADKTVLADMIAYGKSFHFAKRMMPCVADSVFIWYSPEEIKGARQNQDLIWARLIEDQVLYSTNHIIKQKFLGERPQTIEVGEKCPGRIALWIGWKIVDKYAETHPEITLPQLMGITDADKLFKESHYKPKKP